MTVDEYLAAIDDPQALALLTRFRAIIREEAPDAEECISYGMPGYKLNGYMVGFAAFKRHCSLFPGATVADYEHLLAGYKTSKGTIQFPNGAPLDEDLVRTIVRGRAAENRAKPKKKSR